MEIPLKIAKVAALPGKTGDLHTLGSQDPRDNGTKETFRRIIVLKASDTQGFYAETPTANSPTLNSMTQLSISCRTHACFVTR